MIDPTYAAQVLTWAAAWSGVGIAARVYLARAERRQRRSEQAGKGVR